MRLRPLLEVHLLSGGLLLLARAAPALDDDAARGLALFKDYVEPILRRSCFACHSHEGEKAKGGLVLDSRIGWADGGGRGPAIVPGKPSESLLLQVVSRAHPELAMPPDGKLADDDIEKLRQWIALGAPDPRRADLPAARSRIEEGRKHWSFRPVRRPPVPGDGGSSRVHPIDAFVADRLGASGLSLTPPADRRTLIRRAYFDLVGLPPPPGEVEAFVEDTEPTAFDRLIDRLLDSPHYGERWGRHWLDVAGFAESSMFIGDVPRPGFWRYRDYVIRSFNADKPFDRFVLEQLAGDELFDWRATAEFSPEQVDLLAATGFLRSPPDATDNQPITQMDKRHAAQQAAVEVSMKAILGLTVQCARCHDHKFDPIAQEDYYRLVAVFQPAYDPGNWLPGIWTADRPGPLRAIPLLPREERNNLMRESLDWTAAPRDIGSDAGKARRDDLKKKNQAFENVIWCLFDVTTKPAPARLLRRGNYETPGREVAPGLPSVFEDPGKAVKFDDPPGEWTTGRRLALARWLTARDHPLTARVLVNRIWQYHFGTGLVSTPDDFGARGARPVHPEILDWLAAEFVETGWSLKRLHRLIMLSATYRQRTTSREEPTSGLPPVPAAFRPGPRRLEAEVIRDSLLETAGCLDRRLFGPSVPAQRLKDGQFAIKPDHPDRFRRTVYISTRRTHIPTFLALFDEPLMDTNWPRRSASVIPQQALALLNGDFALECAERFARRVTAEGGPAFEERLHRAFALAYGRAPDAEELALFHRSLPAADGGGEPSGDDAFWRTACHALLCSNEFLYVD
jgi:cytochrome c553